jgi:hypothetical protein
VEESRRLQRFGVTANELERYRVALLRDSDQQAEQANSIPHLENLDFVMEALALGNTVMDHVEANQVGGAAGCGWGGLDCCRGLLMLMLLLGARLVRSLGWAAGGRGALAVGGGAGACQCCLSGRRRPLAQPLVHKQVENFLSLPNPPTPHPPSRRSSLRLTP